MQTMHTHSQTHTHTLCISGLKLSNRVYKALLLYPPIMPKLTIVILEDPLR